LTRSGLESTIYHTRGEHADQYATNAVHPLRTKQRTKIHHTWRQTQKQQAY
jgi:hypothetical protein